MVWDLFIYMDVIMSKETFVGRPMTVEEFYQLMDEMHKKDENGVPVWKKIFGVEEGSKGHEPEKSREVKRQLDELYKEMEMKCDKDYPKSRVCYVDIKKAFK